jgi:hypothetical protein
MSQPRESVALTLTVWLPSERYRQLLELTAAWQASWGGPITPEEYLAASMPGYVREEWERLQAKKKEPNQ